MLSGLHDRIVSNNAIFVKFIGNTESYRKMYSSLFKHTVHPRSIAPRFIANLAYCQNSRLSRFPPLKIPCYTAKLSYRHPPQDFRHKSRKTNLNSPVSTAHNYIFDSCVLIGNYGMSRLVIRHGH